MPLKHPGSCAARRLALRARPEHQGNRSPTFSRPMDKHRISPRKKRRHSTTKSRSSRSPRTWKTSNRSIALPAVAKARNGSESLATPILAIMV